MRIIFIRHGKTAGNLEKRYIGKTDQELCAEGIAELEKKRYPDCDIVFSSPMKRCMSTAELIYPEKPLVISEDLRECDFGGFECKNYIELSDDPRYIKWIDSGGTAAFPDGESPDEFKKRCIAAFERTLAEYRVHTAAYVVHGGTIMAVLEKYAVPKKNYYDWNVPNGGGYVTEFDGEKLTCTEEI